VAGVSIDGGTFVYPPFYVTLRDMVHKCWGARPPRSLIVAAAVINLLMAAYFLFLSGLKPDPTWSLPGVASAQAAFARHPQPGVAQSCWRASPPRSSASC
jgi:uncharacterized PurR-regulated membrane protein YhhQ (DUF165 family)